MTQESPRDPIVDLVYAAAAPSRPRFLLTLREFALVGLVALLFIHLITTIVIGTISYCSPAVDRFELAPGQSLSTFANVAIFTIQFSWYAMLAFFMMDLAVFVAMSGRSTRIRRFSNLICAIGLAFVVLGFLTIWIHPPIRILVSGMRPNMPAILDKNQVALVAIIGAGPAALWLTYAFIAAIRSRLRAPSPAPESSRDS